MNDIDSKIINLISSGMSQVAVAAEVGMPRSTLQNRLRKLQGATNLPSQFTATKNTAPVPVKAAGTVLANKKVIPSKPNVNPLRCKIRALPAGRGFTSDELSDEWGDSADRIEKVAKDMRCRRAVEMSPDYWVYMIMEPETAKKFNN
jgi:hypothetical protein